MTLLHSTALLYCTLAYSTVPYLYLYLYLCLGLYLYLCLGLYLYLCLGLCLCLCLGLCLCLYLCLKASLCHTFSGQVNMSHDPEAIGRNAQMRC